MCGWSERYATILTYEINQSTPNIPRGGGYSSREDPVSLKKESAFTLIELLVVIAIIGILATVVIASLNSARGKARDAKRMADIRQVKTAMDMYYADNGRYPVTQPTTTEPSGGPLYYDMGDYVSVLVPAYLPSIPKDPSCLTGGCAYKMISSFPNQDSYIIKVAMENGSYCRTGTFDGNPTWYVNLARCTF